MKRVLSFLMTFALLVTCFSNVAFAEEATGETTGTVYASVEEGQTVDVSLRMGETVTYTLDGSIDVSNPDFDADVVDVQVVPGEIVENPYKVQTGSVAQLATAVATFDGAEVALEDCLFTFTKSGNYYKIYHEIENGSKISLDHYTGLRNGGNCPCTNRDTTIDVQFNGDVQKFYLTGGNNQLLLKKTSSDLEYLTYYMASGQSDNDEAHFDFFISAEDAPVDSPIIGYKKLTSLDEVDGKQCLIVSKVGEDYYLLYPMTGAEKYNYVAKVVTKSEAQVQKVETVPKGQSAFVEGDLTASDCLFTFTSTGSLNGYVISGETAEGTTVYLHHRGSAATATKTTSAEILVLDEEGKFTLYDNSTSGSGSRYLYFHRSNSGYYNQGGSIGSDAGYRFEIYEPSKNAPADSPIKGYAKVTSSGQIKNGGRYLIVSQKSTNDDNAYYLMYPSTGANNYHYVAKVTDNLVSESAIVASDTVISITAVEEGRTNVIVGGVTYQVVVANDNESITLTKGETYTINGTLQKESGAEGVIEKEEFEDMAPYTKASILTDGNYLIGRDDNLIITNNEQNSGLQLVSSNYSGGNHKEYVWTIKAEGNGYTIQDDEGKYINFTNESANPANVILSADTPQVLKIARRSNITSYSVSYSGRYFNKYNGGETVRGWNQDDNAWYFYRGTSGYNVTALAAGEVTLTVSGVNYTINVVDTDELQALITDAEQTYTTTDYVGWDAYQTALEAAKECVTNANQKTQEEINTAKTNLENAIKNLVEIPETPENGIKTAVVGYNLVLKGNIGVKFHMWIAEEVVTNQSENIYMEFTLGEGSEPLKISLAEAEEIGDYYTFECPVPVKDMETSIKAQIVLYDGEEKVSEGVEFPYTVKEYIDYMLAHKDTYANEFNLVTEMNEFGELAATYFDEEAEGVEMSEDAKVALKANLKTALGLGEDGKIDLPVKGTYYGSSLLLKSDTFLRHYFTKEVNVADAGYKVVQKGNYWYVESEGITADKLGEAKTVTVTTVVEDGETPEEITITYSPLTYAYIAVENGDAKLVNLMGAMYEYQQAAAEYIK